MRNCRVFIKIASCIYNNVEIVDLYDFEPKERLDMPKITVYSTPTCPYCIMVKQYLKDKKIEFTNYDVSEDEEKAMEMVKKSGQQGVPVIEINGKIIVGFNRTAIDAELARL